MKEARTSDDAWKIQDVRAGEPHAWIQWKATDVFMDVYCACGISFNINGNFAYHIQCPECGTIYMCNGHIELIKLTAHGDGHTILGE